MYFYIEGLVLKNMDFKEADKIVTVLARKEGKLGLVAKGVKKPKSSLRGVVQPFCYSRLHISKGRGMGLITQGRVLDFYGSIREDLDKTLQVVYLMELLDKCTADADPHPRLFDLALSVLQYLDSEDSFPLVIRWFELRMLTELGFGPKLDRCIRCGQSEALERFSISEGGVLCRGCGVSSQAEGLELSGETLAVLRVLAARDLDFLRRLRVSKRALQQVENLLERFLAYHLERRFNLKNIIKFLKDDNL
ncbi:MAG: DNA repair protein RecO [Syntrophomonadaceae bacterium]|jgi:DNA repair protein RecO (recombination protein O)|nr:DNA repair protein RecO [Syntrophomonadaceae bacterium]